ncbi:glycosyltransferase family 2 protein [Flavobacterium tistrianum]|uniref:glycosyltransferase family 2 protein n=1 Tax=Flavobacterium tistrianum TaxID=1685414 RepID=UPI000DAC2BDA|nr:glycosyltransferase [Flavobacterium tistrianum]KAF2342021.1 glycosyltransferase family 2 protein [Flavobacterium tistrianum]
MIAIVIPYYKLEFFEKTLESLKKQIDKRFKVYIGNDSSPENPFSLLEKYKNDFDFKYYLFEQNLGGISLVKQWERCVDLVESEEWIMILGDDDVLDENVVASFYRNLEDINKNEINVVRFATTVINEKEETISKKHEHPVLETGQDFLTRKFSKKTRSSLGEYFFKREQIKNVKFKDLPLAWHSDDLAVLEFSIPNSIYSINEAQLLIRVSNLSITGDSGSNNQKNWATFEFCEILFKDHTLLFTKFQKKVILKKLEVAFFNIPSFKTYQKITKHYFGQLGFWATIDFQLRLIKYNIILILKKLKIFNGIYAIYDKLLNK